MPAKTPGSVAAATRCLHLLLAATIDRCMRHVPMICCSHRNHLSLVGEVQTCTHESPRPRRLNPSTVKACWYRLHLVDTHKVCRLRNAPMLLEFDQKAAANEITPDMLNKRCARSYLSRRNNNCRSVSNDRCGSSDSAASDITAWSYASFIYHSKV